jgi:glycogen phosphorylase
MRPVAKYTVVSTLPEPLQRLPELAYNIHWAWDHEAIDLFRRMDLDLWEETHHNPIQMLGMISQSKLNALARDDGFLAHYERVQANLDHYMNKAEKAWYPQEYAPEERPQIAYFSFEFGLTESIPNYSGGLGVLAGDHLKAASDLSVPLVGVGLLYQEGYFRQYLNIDGWQQERYPINDFYTMPLRLMKDGTGQPIRISVDFPGRTVYAQIWQVRVGRVNLYLLDTNIPDNSDVDDQSLTDRLYGGDREVRIKQEILLGIGGLRALYTLGIDPSVCHMNEGHAAFLALERARVLMERNSITFDQAVAITSASNVFTTHTPVPAGNDYFKPELVEQYFADYRTLLGLSREDFLALGRVQPENIEEYFCMTVLALRTSTYANAVSRLHGDVARDMWKDVYPGVPEPEVPISSITNGVHMFTWVSQEIASLYDRYLGPRWREEPSDRRVWQRVVNIPGEELWRVHERERERLVNFVRDRLVRQLEQRGAPPSEIDEAHEVLNPDALTIGFARRFATYKRATLLLRDKERLTALMCSDRPVQFIFAGKAHPHDNAGKEFIREIVHFARSTGCRNRLVFLEDYDMDVARYLVHGVDVWMNTPRRPLEASGTSGMKSSMNGGLNLSVLDGWWDEAYRRDLGWAIGRGEEYTDEELQDYIEANATYEMLEKDLIPTFYDRGTDNLPRGWIMRMKAALRELPPVFSMDRVVQEYTRRFYHPALEHAKALSQDGYSRGLAFGNWLQQIKAKWASIKIGEITPAFNATAEVHVGDTLQFTAQVFLGDITPEDVTVQLYEGPLNIKSEIERGYAHDMHCSGPGSRGKGWYEYSVEFVSETTGQHGYTLRVLPNHPDLRHPLRLGLMTWA